MNDVAENNDFESLFEEYWSDVSGVLANTLKEISSNYSKIDFDNAVTGNFWYSKK